MVILAFSAACQEDSEMISGSNTKTDPICVEEITKTYRQLYGYTSIDFTAENKIDLFCKVDTHASE
jgi:hypothetical protein